MTKKNDKKALKKEKGSIVIAVISVVVSIILIAAIFYGIIHGVIKIIESVEQKLAAVTSHTLSEWAGDVAGTVSNFFGELFDLDFSLKEYSLQTFPPTYVIDINQFTTMKDAIDAGQVDRDKAGLDDFMMKKMILAYYRTMYLTDTSLLIELTDEEATLDEEEAEPFEIVEGNTARGYGQDGKYYLEAKGIVKIEYVDAVTGDTTELSYFPKAVLTEIKNNYLTYLGSKANYADSMREQLKTAYTYDTDGGILVYKINVSTKHTKYEYSLEKITSEDPLKKYIDSIEFVKLDYKPLVSEYGTPVEFFVDLLEITGNKEFVNEVIKLMNDKDEITIGLYDREIRINKEENENFDLSTVVTGKYEGVQYTAELLETDADGVLVNSYNYGYEIDVEAAIGDGYNLTLKIDDSFEKEISYAAIYVDGSLMKASDENWFFEVNSNNEVKTKVDKPVDANIEKKAYDNNVTKITTTTAVESSYDLAITKVKNWYADIQQTNNITSADYYSTINATGEEIDIAAPENVITRTDNMPAYLAYYTNPEHAEMFNTTYTKETTNGQKSFFNSIYNYTIRYGDGDYPKEVSYEDCKFNTIRFHRGYNKITTLTKYTRSKLTKGLMSGSYDVEDFIDLLKDASGKDIKYEDLYGAESAPGKLLENGAEMLFDLLEASENSAPLADVMRYILYVYTGNDYGVTNFSQLNIISGDSQIFGNDFNVHVDQGDPEFVLDKATILATIDKMGYSNKAKTNLKGAIDSFIKIQNENKVNAVFAIAVTIVESSGGTAWAAIAPHTHNWMSVTGSYNGQTYKNPASKNPRSWRVYPSFSVATEDFGNLIANGSYYFKAGKYTVRTIAETYCNASWGESIMSEMSKFYNAAGVDSTKMIEGNFLSIAKQCHDYFWKTGGFYYSSAKNKAAGKYVEDGTSTGNGSIPYPNGTSYTDCSAYVTWVLYEYGYTEFTSQKTTHWFNNPDNWKKYGWKKIPISEIQPGDILMKNGHMEIYYGGNKTLNCGSTNAINREFDNYVTKSVQSSFNFGIRVGE